MAMSIPLTSFLLHGCTRLAVKLDFITGLVLKAVETTGSKDYRSVQANVGEIIAWRNCFWSLSEAMARNAKPWTEGTVLPDTAAGQAYQVLSTEAYPAIKHLIEQTVASGLIYANSHAVDFKTPELRGYLDRFVRGSNNYSSEERVKLIKLLWDAIGTEFGARHELYEVNYSGSHEDIRRQALAYATVSGTCDQLKAFAESAMAEYDLNGWKAPDLINPDDVNVITRGLS
jgi:4-hydroxyphenylacetate 3-monooxygenase